MTLKKVLTSESKKLRKVSVELTEEEIKAPKTKVLVSDLIETMEVENGIGIAAPQVGILKRVIIIDLGKGAKSYINPKIVSRSKTEIQNEEGCLSVPGVFGMVKRNSAVTVEFIKPNGKSKKVKVKGLEAIVFQHEIDHLDGILFTDKVVRYTKPESEPKF
jgi:peptide deformylase